MRYTFEDFTDGRVFNLGSRQLSASEIIEFAKEFDPQPMHLSEEAGKKSILGGLAASGWHTCAVFMRMSADAYIVNSTSQGSPGIEYVEWKKPVLAGDTLSGTSTVLETRLLISRPGLGIVKFYNEMTNQRAEIVYKSNISIMFGARFQQERS